MMKRVLGGLEAGSAMVLAVVGGAYAVAAARVGALILVAVVLFIGGVVLGARCPGSAFRTPDAVRRERRPDAASAESGSALVDGTDPAVRAYARRSPICCRHMAEYSPPRSSSIACGPASTMRPRSRT